MNRRDFLASPALAAPILGIGAAAAEPRPWDIDYERSYVRFAAGLFGSKIRGEFERFEADIRLDSESPETSRIEVRVDATSIDTRNSERDAELQKAEWFHVAAFPEIRFRTERLARGDGGYSATGELGILDVTRSMTVPFELEIDEQAGGRIATVSGRTVIRRTDFGLGKGKWGGTSVVRDEVEIEISIRGRVP